MFGLLRLNEILCRHNTKTRDKQKLSNFFMSYIRPLEYSTKGLSIFASRWHFTLHRKSWSYNLWIKGTYPSVMPFSSAVHTSCPVTKGRSGDSKVGLEAGDRGRGGEGRGKPQWGFALVLGQSQLWDSGWRADVDQGCAVRTVEKDRCALCYMHLQQ